MSGRLLNINNIPSELMPEFIEFMQEAEIQRKANKNCNLNEYEQWKKIIGFNENLRDLTNLSHHSNTQNIIDLTTESENSNDDKEEIVNNITIVDIINDNKDSARDLACAVKESLESQKCLSDNLKKDIQNTENCLKVFQLLSEMLNSEEVGYFGESIIGSTQRNSITILFCKYLLIPRILNEYNDNLQQILNRFIIKHLPSFKDELTMQILTKQNSETILQYFSQMDAKCQVDILRNLIFKIEKVEITHLEIIENLLNNCTEVEILTKIIDIIFNASDQINDEKVVGKLLIKIMQLLGQNVLLCEKPLRHLVGIHNSVWKSKLQKVFDNCFEESMMMSQSFR